MLENGMIMSLSNKPSLHPVLHSARLSCRKTLHRLELSSVLVQTNKDGSFCKPNKIFRSVSASTQVNSQNSHLINQSDTIGIMGGNSVLSTLLFLEKLLCWSSRNSKNTLPFILCNNPVLSLEFSISKTDPGLIIENLRQKRSFLEEAGAGCIVMPCHVSHVWHGEVFRGCSVQCLHAADCVAEELKESSWKPVGAVGWRSNVQVGLIGTQEVMNSGFYQEKLQNQGFEIISPDKATMSHIVTPAIEALHKRDLEGARNLLRVAIQILLTKAVKTVILASDEFQGLLPYNDPLLKKCIDPMDALARSTIRWARSADTVAQTRT